MRSDEGDQADQMAITNIRTALYTLGMLSVLALAAGCAPESSSGPANRPSQGPTEVVTAVTVVKPLGVEIEAVGTARANESAEITSKASNQSLRSGLKKATPSKQGRCWSSSTALKRGLRLRKPKRRWPTANVNSRAAAISRRRRHCPPRNLDQIEATLKGNRARVEAARARLADTVIRAGFDGRTGFRRVSVGSVVNPGTVITTLDDASHHQARFHGAGDLICHASAWDCP